MQKLRIGLACLVTGVWLAGYLLAYATGSPQPVELTGLMAVVLGWAFAGHVKDAIAKKVREDKEGQ